MREILMLCTCAGVPTKGYKCGQTMNFLRVIIAMQALMA
eukprot:CAMPEP_0115721704 /NCGR_PEP_ID=MMETSP0272-20121206/79241_1 /TAXON_ID=71861 /ORGANISM="Scrippsiella trochoidea, Strain CCMP3099" /LENGTH=38 /DNA_ID= /DNA_START= /DNA_END= /DNA_ORIENTATION=